MKEQDGVQTLTEKERIYAMHNLREGLRKLYGDRYSKEVSLRINLVRQTMLKLNLAAGDAACYIVNRATRKNDPFIWAAAMEIVDEDTRAIALN